jgi:hypothetical protein
VLRHLVLHRHRLAAIEHALARDRAAAAAAERKLGQALSVQPTIDMSYKQTKIQQHKLASTIVNFAPQVRCLLPAVSAAFLRNCTSIFVPHSSHAHIQEGQVHAAALAASAAAAHVAESDLKRAEHIDAQAGLALDYMQRHAE